MKEATDKRVVRQRCSRSYAPKEQLTVEGNRETELTSGERVLRSEEIVSETTVRRTGSVKVLLKFYRLRSRRFVRPCRADVDGECGGKANGACGEKRKDRTIRARTER